MCVVFTEYTVVLGVCGLAAGLALYGLGVPLVQAYYLTKLSDGASVRNRVETLRQGLWAWSDAEWRRVAMKRAPYSRSASYWLWALQRSSRLWTSCVPPLP